VLARACQPYGLIEGLPAGAAEQHPDTWWAALREVVRQVLVLADADPRAIAGVGVSGQQHGFVALDEMGWVIRPAKLWCDTSTAAEAAELSRQLGRSLPAGFTASKILWLKRREPQHFARLCWVLLPHDYVNFRLTEQKTMEAGDASGTGFFDPVARVWDERALAAIDTRLAAMLPPLVPAGEPAGVVTESAARELGLAPGTLVSAGGGDNMMSAIGSGATRPGVVTLSLGTSGTVFAYSARPLVDPDGLIAPFCDSTGAWLPLLCVMNVTGVADEVRRASGLELDELTRQAEQVETGAGGALFVPYLMGERVPDLPHASGALLGLRPGSLAPGVLFRAALEGTSLNLAWGVERMRALGLSIDAVRAVGGGAQNPLWRQILADALGAPVQALAEPESAALGAALQALWTLRRSRGESLSADEVAAPFVFAHGPALEPDGSRHARYVELGQRFREAVRGLFGSSGGSGRHGGG
jgi:xylulokinase